MASHINFEQTQSYQSLEEGQLVKNIGSPLASDLSSYGPTGAEQNSEPVPARNSPAHPSLDGRILMAVNCLELMPRPKAHLSKDASLSNLTSQGRESVN